MSEDIDGLRTVHALADLVTPMALRVFVSLGVPEIIRDCPVTAIDVAAKCGCDVRILRSILDHLASRGIVSGGLGLDGGYSLTKLGRLTLHTSRPSLQSWLVESLRLGRLQGDLSHSVVALYDVARTGRTAHEEQHGESIWQRVTRMGDDEAMREFGHSASVLDIEPICQLLKPYAIGTVCDVGTGNGKLARALLSGPYCSFCYVVDLAPMVGVADTSLECSGVTEYAAVEADFMTDPLPEADVYIVSDVLADWDDANAVRLLRNIHRACRRDARVLVSELRIPSGAGDLFDQTAGKLRLDVEMAHPNRTVEELSRLGRDAGMVDIATAQGRYRVGIMLEPVQNQ